MTEIRLLPLRLTLSCCLLMAAVLLGAPQNGGAEGAKETGALAAETSCGEAVSLLREQNEKLSQELRRIHREVAALRQEVANPGLKEAFSGIGYILGLFGVAFFFLGRRTQRGE